MNHWTASLFAAALESLSRKQPGGQTNMISVLKSVAGHPFKLIAAFILAPFLAFRIAANAKNPVRRAIAGVGLFIAMLSGWLAGTLLGTAAGALLIAAKIGLLWGLAFIVGTTLSMVLSVAFSILIVNAASYIFLQLSSEDVIEHLRSISE